jgi:alpha/beta superfamily hydrolase
MKVNMEPSSISPPHSFSFKMGEAEFSKERVRPSDQAIQEVALHILERTPSTFLEKSKELLSLALKITFLPITLILSLLGKITAKAGIGGELAKVVNENNRQTLKQMGGEEIKFKVEGGAVLEGMFFEGNKEKAASPQKTILLCTGSHKSFENYAIPMVREILSMGHQVMVNYEGFGKSEGIPSEEGVYRSTEAAYQYLQQVKQRSDQSIVGWGYSLGSGAVTELATKHSIDIVLDRGFSTMAEVSYQKAPYLKTIAKILFVITSYFNNESKIKSVNGRIFIAQGKHDSIMTEREHGERLKKAGKADQMEYHPVESYHVHTEDSIWFDRNGEKREAIEQFLRQPKSFKS